MNTKTAAILTALTLFTLPCLAEERTDTVKIIENASNIVIVKSGGSITLDADFLTDDITENEDPAHYRYEVNVTHSDTETDMEDFPDNWGMEIPFVRNPRFVEPRRVRTDVAFVRRAYWGWRFNYAGRGEVKNGWEIGVPDFIAIVWKRRGAEFEIGAGFSSNIYYAGAGFAYGKTGDRLTLMPIAEGVRREHSRLQTWTFQIPVLYNQKIGHDFMFSLGAVANLNTYAVANTRLELEEGRFLNYSYKGLQQNLLTVDAYASFDICGFGMYARWSPMTLFRKQFGPELKGFSIGINISLM